MISFIIPAYNEEAVIGATLEAVKKHAPSEEFEVIVVDNGSTDKTASIATQQGARVVLYNDGTIAAARNYGVKHSQGDILIFIDADVLLTPHWQDNISQQISKLRAEPMQISGSRCRPPSDYSWFNEYWYGLMNNDNASYINSGHMITTKQVFDSIHGFSEHLKTAEDHDFCQKAEALGAKITPNIELLAIHDGYPKSLKQFIQRERWHGREDFKNFDSFFHSKIALVATGNLLTFILSLLLVLYSANPMPFVIYLTLMLISCGLLGMVKFRFNSVKYFVNNTLIHFIYFWGRSMALIDRLTGKYTGRFRE